MRSVVALPCLVALVLAVAAPSAGAASTAGYSRSCGSVTVPFNGARLAVFRFGGGKPCSFVRKAVRAAVGKDCDGRVVYRRFRCTRGATNLGAPAATGFTLTRGRHNFQAKQA